MVQSLPASMAVPVGEKLKRSRLAKGLSTREVARSIADRFSITHATLSNYEAARTTPPIATLEILASFYGRPLTWFFESGPTLANIHYRNLKSRSRVGDLQTFEADAQRWIEAYWRLEEWLDAKLVNQFADFKSAPKASGRDLAIQLRRRLDLKPSEPIRSVAELFDDFGIRAMELKTSLAVDGMAASFGGENVIVLNPSIANDRCRMNAAHELGHVLHGDCEKECGHGDTVSEKRAYEFASHFLIPDSELDLAFKGQSMVRLVKAKEHFGVSLQAMIYRAEQSGLISKSTAKWLWIEFAKRGWRKHEPGFVRPDRATRFEDILGSAVAEGRLTWESAAKVMRVPEDELHLRIGIALGRGEAAPSEGGDDAEDGPAILMLHAR